MHVAGVTDVDGRQVPHQVEHVRRRAGGVQHGGGCRGGRVDDRTRGEDDTVGLQVRAHGQLAQPGDAGAGDPGRRLTDSPTDRLTD